MFINIYTRQICLINTFCGSLSIEYFHISEIVELKNTTLKEGMLKPPSTSPGNATNLGT